MSETRDDQLIPVRRDELSSPQDPTGPLVPVSLAPPAMPQPSTSSWPTSVQAQLASPVPTPAAAMIPTPPDHPASPTQANHQTVNVTTTVGGPTMIFTHHRSGPGFFIRAIWYLFVGWWLSAIAIVVGYAAMVTIVGLPLAFYIVNRLPTLLTLRPRTQDWAVEQRNGVTHVGIKTIVQRPWWQRAVYFVLIGWWFSALWLVSAWAIGLLVITLPISFWMFNRISAVVTLQRH